MSVAPAARARAPSPLPASVSGPCVAVAVARPVRGEFTYRVPEAMAAALRPGHRVAVPFGRGTSLGFYLGPAEEPEVGSEVVLKSVARLLDPERRPRGALIPLPRSPRHTSRYRLARPSPPPSPPAPPAP